MSDLIKRSSVIKILEENGWLDDSCLDELINQIPTAYDIDKVVEELEELKTEYDCTSNEFQRGAKAGAEWLKSKAIEIVKAGGKD